jgi:hypothetical protein
MAKPPAKTGRPSIFTAELAAAICARLEAGESLRSICRDDAMPARDTVYRWVAENNAFSDQYVKARDIGLDSMAEETLEIADDGSNDWMEKKNADGSTYETVNSEHIQRSRLRVDARKWYLSKLAPKRYGDSARVEHTGADGGPIEISWQTPQIAPLAQPGDGARDVTPRPADPAQAPAVIDGDAVEIEWTAPATPDKDGK